MRRTIAATVLALSTTVAGLAMGLAPGAAARTADPSVALPDLSSRIAAERAGRALSAADEVLDGTTPASARARPEATLVMRDLFMALPDLDPAERERAGAVLARPTDGDGDPNGDGYRVPAKRTCDGRFCVHWVPVTADAPPDEDWVATTLKTMQQVWRREIGQLGYRKPVPDGSRGGNEKFDVYLKDVGAQGLYGYCAPERRKPGNKWLASGYCVLDNDFAKSQFGGAPPLDSLRVTAAHEFFHAIQFAYDYGEDKWLMEATSTWMEERFVDQVNDNRQYLPYGQVQRPATSLDTFDRSGFNQYGNWAFFEFLSDRYRDRVVRAIWDGAGAYADAGDRYSIKAVAAELADRGGLPAVFAAYAAANTAPAASYAEGRHWPRATIAREWAPTRDQRSAGTTFRINHLAARSVLVRPDPAMRGELWQLRVAIDGPGSKAHPAAHLVVRREDGRLVHQAVRLNTGGKGIATVPFSSRRVTSVTITLANVSTRFRCWAKPGTPYSCQGNPRDQRESFDLSVAAFKR